MKKIMTVIFLILLMGCFAVFLMFQKNYRYYIVTPQSIFHEGEHVAEDYSIGKKDNEDGHEHEHHDGEHTSEDLDYMHIRILNHPWNNARLVEIIALQGVFFLLLGAVLWRKNTL